MAFNNELSNSGPSDLDATALLESLNNSVKTIHKDISGFATDIIQSIKNLTDYFQPKNGGNEESAANGGYVSAYVQLQEQAAKNGKNIPNLMSVLSSNRPGAKMAQMIKQVQSKSPPESGTPLAGNVLTLNFGMDSKTFKNDFTSAKKMLEPFTSLINQLNMNINAEQVEALGATIENIKGIVDVIGQFSFNMIKQFPAFVIATSLPYGAGIKKFINNTFTNLQQEIDNDVINKNVATLSAVAGILTLFSKDLVKQYPDFVVAINLPFAKEIGKFVDRIHKYIDATKMNEINVDLKGIPEMIHEFSAKMILSYFKLQAIRAFNPFKPFKAIIDSVKIVTDELETVNFTFSGQLVTFLNVIDRMNDSFDKKKMEMTYKGVKIFSKMSKIFADSIPDMLTALTMIVERTKGWKFNKSKAMYDSSYRFVHTMNGLSEAVLQMSKAVKNIKPGSGLILNKFILGIFNTLSIASKKSKTLRKGAYTLVQSIGGVAKAIMLLGLSAIFIPAAVVTLLFLPLMMKLFESLGNRKTVKSTKDSKKSLGWIAKGIIQISLAFVVASLAMKFVNPVNMLIFIGLLAMTTLAFALIGRFNKYVKKGSVSLLLMSLGLAVFSGALIIMGYAIKDWGWNQIGMAIALVLGIGMSVVLIGNFASQALLGSLALLTISIGLIAFSIGLFVMNMAIKDWDWSKYGMVMALIVGIAAAFILIGIPVVAGMAMLGALAIIVISAALIVFGIGLTRIDAVIGDWDMKKVLMTGLIIVGFGLAFAVVGFAVIPILLGAVAMIVVGFALGKLAIGLSSVNDVMQNLDFKKMIFLGILILGLGIIFGLLGFAVIPILLGAVAMAVVGFALGKLAIGLSSVSAAIQDLDFKKMLILGVLILGLGIIFGLLGFASPLIVAGAWAVGKIGPALFELSKGLETLKNIPIFTTDELKRIGLTVGGVIAAFALIGLGGGKIRKGAETISELSTALILLAKGLRSIEEINKMDIDTKRLRNVINAVGSSFGAIGKVAKEGSDTAKTLGSASLVSPRNVKNGIKAMLQSGDALISVSRGLMMFSAMTSSLNLDGSKKNGVWIPSPGSLGERIAVVLGVVSSAFAQIGGSKNEGMSFTKALLGTDLKKSDVENGINSVMNAGKALTSVADGLSIFDKMTNTLNLDVDENGIPVIGSVGQKITTVLGIVSTAFAQMGSSKNEGMSYFKAILGTDLKKSDVENGINSVMNVNKALTSVADGIKGFHDKTSKMDLRPKGTILTNIVSVIGAIHSVFSDIGSDKDGSIFKSFFGADFGKTNTEKGINAVKGVGKELTSIGDSLAKFKSFSTDDINKSTENIKKAMYGVFRMLSHVFNSWDMDDMKDGTVILKDMSWMFPQISDNFFKFIKNTKKLTGWQEGFNNFKGLLYSSIVRVAAIGGNESAWNKVYSSLGDEPYSSKQYDRGAKNLVVVAKGLVGFSNIMGKFNIANMDLSNLDKILTFTTKMEKNIEPLERIADSFRTIADSIQTMVEYSMVKVSEKDDLTVFDKIMNIGSQNLDDANRTVMNEVKTSNPKVQEREEKREASRQQDNLTSKLMQQVVNSNNQVAALIAQLNGSVEDIRGDVEMIKANNI